MVNNEDFWPELEQLGVEKVRQNLAGNIYSEYKAKSAEAWLRHKEYQLLEESERSNSLSRLEKKRQFQIAQAIQIILAIAAMIGAYSIIRPMIG